MKRKRIKALVEVDTFKEAKELLEDLEILKEKYEIAVTISICPLAKLGLSCDPSRLMMEE